MQSLTEYGKRAKKELITLDMSQQSLIDAVRKRTGMYCDYKVLARAFTGKAVHEDIMRAINEILGLSDS